MTVIHQGPTDQHIILTKPFRAESSILMQDATEKIRESIALQKDDILAAPADKCVTSELRISLDKAYDNLTDDHKLKRELKERHSKSEKEPLNQLVDNKDSSPTSLKEAAASVCKASFPRRRLPDNVLKSTGSGSNHKITVYVKYEEQLKEGCVDSDGKF